MCGSNIRCKEIKLALYGGVLKQNGLWHIIVAQALMHWPVSNGSTRLSSALTAFAMVPSRDQGSLFDLLQYAFFKACSLRVITMPFTLRLLQKNFDPLSTKVFHFFDTV